MISNRTKPDRGRRQHTFDQMVDHVRASLPNNPRAPRKLIVETGTCANSLDHIGAGCSTELWNELVESLGVKALSIDIDPAAIRIARFQFKNVHFMCGDASEVLRHMPPASVDCIALLYLDSMWDPTGEQALRELGAIWSRLPPGCMVAIDDRHSDEVGKHVATEAWLRGWGVKPVFCDYQIGWIKP